MLTTTNITAADRKKYDKVVEKLDGFFKVRRNTSVFERAKFNRRNQMQGESIEQYITALFNLRETCEFGDLADQLLRDRIIVGIRDTALAERLMLDAKLDLDKVMQLVRQKEAVHQHSKQLQGTRDDPIVVDYVGRSKGRYHNRSQTQRKEVKGQGQPKKSQKTTGGAKSSALCKRCGKDHSSDDKCPARGVTCFKCEKKGHFASVCLSRSVAATTKETSDTDAIFLGALQRNSKNQPNVWTTDLLLQGQNVTFKIDTGAEVTAINQYTLKRLPQCTPKTCHKDSSWTITATSESDWPVPSINSQSWRRQELDPDSLRGQGPQGEPPWTPNYYVSTAAFSRQLRRT